MCPFEDLMEDHGFDCVYHQGCLIDSDEMYIHAGNGDSFCYQAIDKLLNDVDFDENVKKKSYYESL